MVEANVDVEEAKGELILELVEGGKRFTATIDLTNGRAVLALEAWPDLRRRRIQPSNMPALIAWPFPMLTISCGCGSMGRSWSLMPPRNIVPTKSGAAGMRSSRVQRSGPWRFGAGGDRRRGAKLVVTRLQLWRDIYYVADSSQRIAQSPRMDGIITDFAHPFDHALYELPRDPSLWDRFRERNHVEFPLTEDQFFVMGDNSPASSDARLWLSGDSQSGGQPGGSYLERQLLIGKALCVYWPHSWNRIPGTPIPFPLFPNVEDMRIVR